MKRSLDEIKEKIKNNKATVVRADEMTKIVSEQGYKEAFNKVDVVTTGTFGAMCSSGVFFNFKHYDPPTKLQDAYLNNVKVYGGIAAVDIYLGVTEQSKTNERYGGAQIIEDLLKGKTVELKSTSKPSDCYPGKEIEQMFKLQELNQAIMLNPRNAYQKYNAATNTGKRALNTYMGKLLPEIGNINYSGAGELNPIINDPDFETIGAGSRIFIGGTIGMVVGSGTQHNPQEEFATLMTTGNLKEMSTEFIKAAYFKGYGPTLFIGIGIAIPILNTGIARKTGISDKEINVDILDFAVKSNNRPTVKTTNYHELRSGKTIINGKAVRTSSLSSLSRSKTVSEKVKMLVLNGIYEINRPTGKIKTQG